MFHDGVQGMGGRKGAGHVYMFSTFVRICYILVKSSLSLSLSLALGHAFLSENFGLHQTTFSFMKAVSQIGDIWTAKWPMGLKIAGHSPDNPPDNPRTTPCKARDRLKKMLGVNFNIF